MTFRESTSSVGKFEEVHLYWSRSAMAIHTPESELVLFSFKSLFSRTMALSLARAYIHLNSCHIPCRGSTRTLEFSKLTHVRESNSGEDANLKNRPNHWASCLHLLYWRMNQNSYPHWIYFKQTQVSGKLQMQYEFCFLTELSEMC